MSSANAQAEIGVPMTALPDNRAISRRGGGRLQTEAMKE
jgi:hypothetical protein